MPVELGRLVCSALLNVLIGHRVEVHMLVALGRLAPTAIEQGDGGADLSGRREGQRKPRSGPAVQHLRWGRERKQERMRCQRLERLRAQR